MKYYAGMLWILLVCQSRFSYSQKTDSTVNTSNFSGAVTVTNNGISLVPTFSLGKPAVIFDGSFGKRLSFDPQLRFALEGKPWTFIFWWRYKLVNTDKFRFGIGAHPALAFFTVPVISGGVSKEIIQVRRYLAYELSPNYFLTGNISLGMYYLYGYCLESDAIRNTHFLTLNMGFSNIKLTDRFYMKLVPQFYYLKLDKTHGFYFTSTLTLMKKEFPLSASAFINKSIRSDIAGSKDFIWSINLIYSFNKKYAEM